MSKISELEAEVGLPLLIHSGRNQDPMRFAPRATAMPPQIDGGHFTEIDPRCSDLETCGVKILSLVLPPGTERDRYADAGTRPPGRAWQEINHRWPQSMLVEGATPYQYRGHIWQPPEGYTPPRNWHQIEFSPAPRATIQSTVRVYYNTALRVVALPFYLEYFDSQRLNFDEVIAAPVRLIAEALDMDSLAETAAEAAREAFIAAVSDRTTGQAAQAREEANQAESNVIAYQRNLGMAIANLHQANLRAVELERAEAAGTSIDPADEWAALNRNSKLASVSSRNGTLILRTVELTLTDPHTGDVAPLGEMEITLPLNPASGGRIVVRNLTNSQGGRAHPHVGGGGEPCWGTIGPTIMQASATQEYGALTELLLQFLEVYNPEDSWGSYARPWFERARQNGRLNENGDDESAEAPESTDDDGLTPLQRAARELGITQVTELPPLRFDEAQATPVCPSCASNGGVRSEDAEEYYCERCDRYFVPTGAIVPCSNCGSTDIEPSTREGYRFYCRACGTHYQAE